MINDITIKVYSDPRIVDTSILKLSPVGNYEPLFLLHQSMITFGARKSVDYLSLTIYNLFENTF